MTKAELIDRIDFGPDSVHPEDLTLIYWPKGRGVGTFRYKATTRGAKYSLRERLARLYAKWTQYENRESMLLKDVERIKKLATSQEKDYKNGSRAKHKSKLKR